MSAPDIDEIQPTRERTDDPESPDVATMLVQIGAVGIGADEQFTFASGLRSPIYCDNRLLLSHPRERKAVVRQLVRLIEQIAGVGWDAIAGVASAGIPFAAWVAHEFDKPMVYVRPSEKEHGRQKRIEGGLAAGKRVILVEDLVTTGDSALSAVSALREAGLTCDYCVSIVDYCFVFAASKFKSEQVIHKTLTNTEGLLSALRTYELTSEEDLGRVRTWQHRVNATGGGVPT